MTDESTKRLSKEMDFVKKIRKYDRDELLKIGKLPASNIRRDDIDIVDIIRNKQFNYWNPSIKTKGYAFPHKSMQIPPTSLPTTSERGLNLSNVNLHKAENAWKRRRNEPTSPIELIVKQTRGILNKLTPDNFNILCNTFLELQLNDQDDRISAVIDLLFEKAIDEPNFSPTYARIVHHVSQHSQQTAKKFRKEIIDTCQKEFQKITNDEKNMRSVETEIQNAPENQKEQMKLDLEDKMVQMRRRSLGNIRFIGELYKLQMLSPKIMIDCIQLLLRNQDEESYECLCKLLTTVGQKLDHQLKEFQEMVGHAKMNSQKIPKFIPQDKFMDKTFEKLHQLGTDTSKLSSRIRFALLDIVELRENDWKPRRDINVPRTIQQVHYELYLQDQQEKNLINALPNPLMGSHRYPETTQHVKFHQNIQNGWNTSKSNKSSRFSATTKSLPETQPNRESIPILAPRMTNWISQPMNKDVNDKNNRNFPPRTQKQESTQIPSLSFVGQLSDDSSEQLTQQIPQFGSSNEMELSPSNRFNSLSNQLSIQPVPPSKGQRVNILKVKPPTSEENEIVKHILHEFCNSKWNESTLDWVNQRFPGEKVLTFVDCLARQVGEMSKPEFQFGAGQLIKLLINQKLISKDIVLRVLTEGLISDIPDVKVDCPKVITYVAPFILEIFGEENNFNWLIELTRPIQNDKDLMMELIEMIVSQLEIKKNEEYVKIRWKMTDERDSLSKDLKFCPVVSS